MQFPKLSTGSFAQYPTLLGIGSPAAVIRFLDGNEQRYLTRGRELRRWLIDLKQMNEAEIAAIEQFFRSQGGEYSSFDFPDPLSGATVRNCRFASPEVLTSYLGTEIAATSVLVVETNG